MTSLLRAPVEDFALAPGTAPFDFAVARRAGGLDGRHPGATPEGGARHAHALRSGGRPFIDGAALAGAAACVVNRQRNGPRPIGLAPMAKGVQLHLTKISASRRLVVA